MEESVVTEPRIIPPHDAQRRAHFRPFIQLLETQPKLLSSILEMKKAGEPVPKAHETVEKAIRLLMEATMTGAILNFDDETTCALAQNRGYQQAEQAIPKAKREGKEAHEAARKQRTYISLGFLAQRRITFTAAGITPHRRPFYEQ